MNTYRLNEEERKLVETHMDLVSTIVSSFPHDCFDSREDACQTGAIGLMKAARYFEAEKGVQFTTYASTCIRNELLMGLRRVRARRRYRFVSLDEALPSAEGESFCLLDVLPAREAGPEEICSGRESLNRVRAVLRESGDEEALTIVRMLLRGRRQSEIAQAIGCTQSAVSRKLGRIRQMLRQAV